MAQLGGTFDANTVEPNAPYEVLPAGDYRVQIVASEMKPTKNNDGEYLQLELEVLEGPQQGRKLFDRLNLVNKNAQAADIAQRTLSAICHATGKLTIEDSEEVHFIPMIVKVAVKPYGDGHSNEVKGYKPASAGSVATASAPRSAAPAAKPAASSPPWKKVA